MNLNCSYCHMPFTLGMAEKVAALQKMQAENLHHYDAHCPRCGHANAVSRERLEMFTPGWQEAVKDTASASTPVSSPELRAPAPESRQMPSAPTPAKAPAKPAAKKPAEKKPAAKKVVKAKPKSMPKKAIKKTAVKKKTKRK